MSQVLLCIKLFLIKKNIKYCNVINYNIMIDDSKWRSNCIINNYIYTFKEDIFLGFKSF